MGQEKVYLPECEINTPGTSDGFIFNYPMHVALCFDYPQL